MIWPKPDCESVWVGTGWNANPKAARLIVHELQCSAITTKSRLNPLPVIVEFRRLTFD